MYFDVYLTGPLWSMPMMVFFIAIVLGSIWIQIACSRCVTCSCYFHVFESMM